MARAFPDLHAGDKNLAVRAMQNGVVRALKAKGIRAKNNRKGVYGSNTVKDVLAFKIAYGITPYNGKAFGLRSWRKLNKHLTIVERNYLRRYWKAQEVKTATAKEKAIRTRINNVAIEAHRRGGFTYRQVRPMADSLFSDAARTRTDCSSFATLCYKEAGAIDPNGFGYNGYGWTGTMDSRGTRGHWVDEADVQPGDLAFYGPHRGATTHVAVVIEGGGVVSLGHTPIERYATRRYRRDYVGCKRYDVV